MAETTLNSGIDWMDVTEGQAVTGFDLPMTTKAMVLASAGTRDYMPYHHNSAFALKLGIREAFVNTTYLQALMSRCATDWAGPRAIMASMSLTMSDQLCLGDVAHVEGVVSRKFADGERRSVEIEVTITTKDGRKVAKAPIVLDLIADGLAPSPRALSVDPPAVELDDEMPITLRDRLDERFTREAPFPVSEAQIGYWCDMVRDANPVYQGGNGGEVIAPAASMSIWNLNRAPQLGLDSSAPDVDAPDQEAWPSAVASDWPFEWRAPGAREVIVQRRHAEFGAPIRPGDVIRSTAQLLNCSGLRKTKLGDGYFLSRYEVYQNQRGDVIGATTMSLFQYGIDDEVT
ncbi:hypothetical protein LG299_06865 [Microbacterium lacus]|uniref:hypothetical protein n=1 Tax=Microbacterium lacus TaxID=415217 RepID=UPI00384A6EAB